MKKILFKAEMVQKILVGEKTQTRRIHSDMSKPRYNVGDIVYVGETYAIKHDLESPMDRIKTLYAADYYESPEDILWKSGMFMPEKYSRIKLRITSAKKHAVGLITAAEARAEGFNGYDEFMSYFKKLCPGIDWNIEVWAYTFEVLK